MDLIIKIIVTLFCILILILLFYYLIIRFYIKKLQKIETNENITFKYIITIFFH